ncbi:hypothetical protein BHM03_00042390 [Ensete ventricosum]|nr:hypothetical protein BHM03_00042390 [Ensete ventricosum]
MNNLGTGPSLSPRFMDQVNKVRSPLKIACYYYRMVALRSMSKKAIKSQSESSKVASEAVANPRTVTAFSSQDRILHLFGSTQKRPAILGSQHRPRRLPGSHEVQLVVTSSFWYGGQLMFRGHITSEAG